MSSDKNLTELLRAGAIAFMQDRFGTANDAEDRDRWHRDLGLVFDALTQIVPGLSVPTAERTIAERTAQIAAHRACCGTEHDPANGKLHGYCVVCGVPWPCEYAGTPVSAEATIAPVAWRYRTKNSAGQWSMWAVVSSHPGQSNYEQEIVPLYEGRASVSHELTKKDDPWTGCEFGIIAWEIDQGQIGISVKHSKGGSAWVVTPNEHVQKLLRDGLRYRWLRGYHTDYSEMAQKALCAEAMDEWIDKKMASQPVSATTAIEK